MKTIIKLAITALATLSFIGCSGSPKPLVEGAKPKAFVKSHTAEKFKDIRVSTAVWNGISPYFVKKKQYMRCDMTEELMVTLVHYDFEIVTDPKDADYTFDTTLLACGGTYDVYVQNRSELPLEERALYKDFMRWVDETSPSDLPPTAKEIAELIKDNNRLGFERFHYEGYPMTYGNKFDYSESWKWGGANPDLKYANATRGVALPNKYAEMSDEDKKILQELGAKFQASSNTDNRLSTGSHMASSGFSMMSGQSINSTGGSIGAAGAVVGLLLMSSGPRNPDVQNLFKVTSNKTGKSWSKIVRAGHTQTWDTNIKKPIDDWFVDEIPWNDLD